MQSLLRLSKITKSYAGVQALKDVSFELKAGEVHALVGENGAGKSTLVKIISGAVTPDSGEMTVSDEAVNDLDPMSARALGIACIYQQPALFPDLTVAENLALEFERRGWRWINWRGRKQQAEQILSRIGARIDPLREVRELSMPEQQLVEIARALASEARILIMDEPTASLADQEVQQLFRVIRELKESGVGIIYISHRLDELPTIADRVTALRDGRWVGTHPMNAIDRAGLIRLMVGRDIAVSQHRSASAYDRVVLDVENLRCADLGVQSASFQVHQGEILGIAGLIGAGRTELAQTLFGIVPADAGVIRINGKICRIDSPAAAVRSGLAYVPEDRRRHGVVLDLPVAANTTLAVLRDLSVFGWLDRKREITIAREYVSRLDVKTKSIHSPVGELSGGNQQKVSLARWLVTKPKALILDEPTQGVDIGAKAEILALIRKLAEEGLAVVMISSELPELLATCDRIAVMRRGKLVQIINRNEATEEHLLELALGGGEQ